MYVFGIWASDNDSRELRYALCQVSFSRQYRTGQVWEAAAGQYAPPAVGLAGIKHELATQRLSRSTSAPPSAWLGPASWCKMVLLASGFAQSPTVLPRGQTSRSCRGLARVLTKIWSIKCLLSWNGKLPSFLLLKTELKTRILQGWTNLGKGRDNLRNLCDSMPSQACSGSVGGRGRLNQILSAE